jgi:hypothetical protein
MQTVHHPEHEVGIPLSNIGVQHYELKTGDAVDEITSTDIRNFIDNGLKNIMDENRDWLPEFWPGPANVGKVVKYSSRLFIWAATVIRERERVTVQEQGCGMGLQSDSPRSWLEK